MLLLSADLLHINVEKHVESVDITAYILWEISCKTLNETTMIIKESRLTVLK